MKFILLLSLLVSQLSYAGSISGVVKLSGETPKGVLYIFAKKYNSKMPMPVAVKKMVNPKYPVKFNLSHNDAMMKQIPFEGPFVVTARVSPSGSVMDKSGVETSTNKPIKIGDTSIELVLSK